MSLSKSGHLSRRRFLQVSGMITGSVAAALVGCSKTGIVRAVGPGGFTVSLHHDPGDPIASSASVQWALSKLRDALTDRGVTVLMRTDNQMVGDLAVFA